MKYIVGKYHSIYGAHECEDESGGKMYIDLIVSDDLEVINDDYCQFIKDLVGKVVEIEDLEPFISIGSGVKVLT